MTVRGPGDLHTLLERDREVSAIAAAIDAVRAGDGTLLAFEGPAGIGKTRLLDVVRQRAPDHGLSVLSARGGELEIGFSYGVVRQLLEQTVSQMAPRSCARPRSTAPPPTPPERWASMVSRARARPRIRRSPCVTASSG